MSSKTKTLILAVLITVIWSASSIADEVVINDEKITNWLLVDSAHDRVIVMSQQKPVRVFEGAAFGLGGVGQKKSRGDKVTPKGAYRIGWENDKSQFRHFYGLTYPSIHDANLAIIQRRISIKEYQHIVSANQNNQIPPQNTALGGQVGIHGLGSRDLKKHQAINWTFGCIALTNKQIDEIAIYLKVGMVVVVN